MSHEIATADAPAESNISADLFDVRNHDGIITIHNPATGNHRTFRVKTVTRGNMKDMRVVSLLDGPDNSTDYHGFGFASSTGIKVWRKFVGQGKMSDYERFALMLEDPAKYMAKGLEYMAEKRCMRCGRKLTHPDSLISGIGPECAKK